MKEGQKQTTLSFLPLAHAFASTMELGMFACGVRVGFFSGDVRTVVSDCQALQPDFVQCVPRVWNRIYDAMNAKIDEMPAGRQRLIRWAIAHKIALLKEGRPSSLMLDALIFANFRRILGGRVAAFISGGAPVIPEVFHFLRATITPHFVQGYGCTETCSTGTVAFLGCHNHASVGQPFVMADIKLRRIDGLDYDPRAPEPAGEVMIRGPSLMKGYHKDPALTEAAIVDGWFATGDIGRWNARGELEIVDRVKMLVKLSQGEYISLTSLTDIYHRAQGVLNVCVFADPRHDFPVAVVVPTQKQIDEWRDQGIADCRSQPAKDDMVKKLGECAAYYALLGYEKVKRVVIDPVEFTIENGLMTPSMKPHFHHVRKRFEREVQELYA